MRRIGILVAELLLVAAAVFAADLLQESIAFVPYALIRLPEVDYSSDDFWTVLRFFLAVDAVVLVLAQLILGPWRPSESRRSIDEVFALAVGFAVAALSIFVTTTVAFDPQFVVGIGVCSTLALLLVHFAAALRTTAVPKAIAGTGRALVRRVFSIPGVLIMAFAVSPGILAKLFVSDRDVANVITQIRIAMSGRVTGDWVFVDARPGQTFHQPIELQFPPGRDDELYVLERAGRILRIPWGRDGEPETLLDVRDRVGYVEVENGALGFDFHPEFGRADSPNRGSLYLYYTAFHDDEQINRLSRFDMTRDTAEARAATESPLIVWNRDNSGFHNGGSVEFGPDGFLYVAVGEMTDRSSYQSIERTLKGGILRIDVDRRGGEISHPIRRQPMEGQTEGYFIPSDNPFCGVDGALEEFWAIGLRNCFRISFDPDTDWLWVGELGNAVWEEVNVVRGGHNYQFPYIEGREETGTARPPLLHGVDTGPIYTYQHTAFDRAVIGGIVYRADRFPQLRGLYVFGDNYSGKIFTLPATGERVDEVAVLGQAPQFAQRGFTTLKVSPDGEILLTVMGRMSGHTGKIMVLRPRAETSVDDIELTAAGHNGDDEIVTREDASKLYKTNCARCHGAEGRGDGPDAPELGIPVAAFTDPTFLHTRPDERLRRVIVDGGPAAELSALMPPWGHILTPNETDALIELIRSFSAPEAGDK